MVQNQGYDVITITTTTSTKDVIMTENKLFVFITVFIMICMFMFYYGINRTLCVNIDQYSEQEQSEMGLNKLECDKYYLTNYNGS